MSGLTMHDYVPDVLCAHFICFLGPSNSEPFVIFSENNTLLWLWISREEDFLKYDKTNCDPRKKSVIQPLKWIDFKTKNARIFYPGREG
jgi:hypothetical protein